MFSARSSAGEQRCSKMKLLLATRSHHKIAEIRALLGHVIGLELLDLDGISVPPDPAEDELEPYDTFAENARSKAAYFQRLTRLPTVADDSGIEIDALGGRPGVRSRRFAPLPDTAGREEQDEANNRHLLELLAGVEPTRRTARYVCVAALVEGAGRESLFRGTAEGIILEHPRGSAGFGYDPLFEEIGLGLTFAEVDAREKHARSHRGEAFQALAAHLQAR
jgi:XTP/dITP diphosphohydrolase